MRTRSSIFFGNDKQLEASPYRKVLRLKKGTPIWSIPEMADGAWDFRRNLNKDLVVKSKNVYLWCRLINQNDKYFFVSFDPPRDGYIGFLVHSGSI